MYHIIVNMGADMDYMYLLICICTHKSALLSSAVSAVFGLSFATLKLELCVFSAIL